MIRLSDLVNRYGTKPLLIGLAAVLVALNLVRLAIGYYDERQESLQTQRALLVRYQKAVQELPELQNRVARLERQKKQFERYLFSGSSEEEIASAMQILLQEKLVKAGLEPESLRPLRSGETAKSKEYGEISLKIRSSGTLNEFMQFLATLYKAQHLFRIESFTLKPYNQTELKIFIDFKGYYKLA